MQVDRVFGGSRDLLREWTILGCLHQYFPSTACMPCMEQCDMFLYYSRQFCRFCAVNLGGAEWTKIRRTFVYISRIRFLRNRMYFLHVARQSIEWNSKHDGDQRESSTGCVLFFFITDWLNWLKSRVNYKLNKYGSLQTCLTAAETHMPYMGSYNVTRYPSEVIFPPLPANLRWYSI